MKIYIYFVIFAIIFINLNQLSKNYKTINYEYIFVTSIYVGKAKYMKDKYKIWSNHFANVIKDNLFIFCNIKGYKILNPRLKKFVKVINDVFDLNRIKDYKDIYKEMWKIDPEKNIHNYRLYGIWNGKISMLKYVSDHIKSKIYIWIDIGSNRENKTFIKFPSIRRIKYLQNITQHSLLFFFQLYDFPKLHNSNITLIKHNCIEGGTFGGSKFGIREYYNNFFSLHDKFNDLKEFVGKDQILYNTLAYYNLSKVVLLKYKSNNCNNSVWFRFYDFYAGEECAAVKSIRV